MQQPKIPRALLLLRKKLDNLKVSDYHGLKSPGLTCYLNSVLQVFFMTEDFRYSIKSGDSANIDKSLGDLFAALETQLAKTDGIIKHLEVTDVYTQRDAAEYYEKILRKINPEVSKIFRGELNHKTTCVGCKDVSNSCNFFWILPLAMKTPTGQTYCVEKGLNDFFKPEKVDEDNKIYCNQCNKKEYADICFEMTQNPDILTLLLMRFTFDYKRKCYVKIDRTVEVPQTLYVKNCTYVLYALVNHFGNLTDGHYTSEIKSFETGEWYCFNDQSVQRVKQPLFGPGINSVRSHSAYLLMYRRERTHKSEKTKEVNQEAHCAQFSVDTEERYSEAEIYHHQLKDGSCNGETNMKHLNGETHKKTYDDVDWRNHKEINLTLLKEKNYRSAGVSKSHLDTKADRHSSRSSLVSQHRTVTRGEKPTSSRLNCKKSESTVKQSWKP